MQHPVLSSLLPVVILIAIGFIAARAHWIRAETSKDLSNLVFLVLTPALLFRTMSTVQVQQLNFAPVALYFMAAFLLFAAMLLWHGLNRRATVLALAVTFSNTVMIGVPLIGLAYGQAGLVILFTLISVHALVLLTTATIALELAVAREAAVPGAAAPRSMARTLLVALRNGILHPVPLPILLGLLFAQTGLSIPPVLDKPLALLGQAFGPLALLLVGVTLTQVRVGEQWRAALGLALLKNLVFPALVALLSLALGSNGLALSVMVVAASMPIGANVFLFSQRYEVAQDLVTAGVALSTALALLSVTLVMAVLGLL